MESGEPVLVITLPPSPNVGTVTNRQYSAAVPSGDPMLGVYQHRSDKDKVAHYLNQLDAESKARKARPAVYKRGYQAKPTSTSTAKKQQKKSWLSLKKWMS